MRLVEDVYCYPWQGQGNNCNSYALRYFVDGVARYALIDPGLTTVPMPIVNGGRIVGVGQEPGREALLAELRADGIEPESVNLVINTHAHSDHCESSLWWKETYGSLVAVHEAEQGFYALSVRGRAAPNMGSREKEDDAAPDLFLGEGELLLGKPQAAVLQVLHTPGHSPGGISIYWSDRRVLIVGDLIFYRSVGRTDLPGGSITKMREGIRRLSQLDVEHLLTGHAYGHPGVISGRNEVEVNFRYVLAAVLP